MLLGLLQFGFRQAAEVENLMTSVERILEYGDTKSEADLKCKGGSRGSWPNEGQIEFKNVSLAYGDNDQPVLKGLSFKIFANEKASNMKYIHTNN